MAVDRADLRNPTIELLMGIASSILKARPTLDSSGAGFDDESLLRAARCEIVSFIDVVLLDLHQRHQKAPKWRATARTPAPDGSRAVRRRSSVNHQGATRKS